MEPVHLRDIDIDFRCSITPETHGLEYESPEYDRELYQITRGRASSSTCTCGRMTVDVLLWDEGDVMLL